MTNKREDFYKSGICCDCPQEDALADYVEAKVREAKREAYKESLRAYRQDKLINWQEYIEKQIKQNKPKEEQEQHQNKPEEEIIEKGYCPICNTLLTSKNQQNKLGKE